MDSPKIAVIGAGNMGSGIIGGLIKNGTEPSNIFVTDPDAEKREKINTEFGATVSDDNVAAINHANVVIFAVKPQTFETIAKPLADAVQNKKPLIISIAAGIRIAKIADWLGGNLPIIRAMPNTPALLSCGATGLFANESVSPHQCEIAEMILNTIGITAWVDSEEKIDAVTALSGSGPAYFFLVMEALEDAAKELGLDEETAHSLTLQTALGAACMAIETHQPLPQLRKNVTSPGGTTEKALGVLENEKIRDIFKQALSAAKQRAFELGE